MAGVIGDLRNNLKKPSKHYNVPMSILQRRVKSTKDASNASLKSLGLLKTKFMSEQEKELADFILNMESQFFELGTKELRQVDYQFVERNGIQL